MNHHWGFGADDFHYFAPPQIIENLALCRKVGANFLLNVGSLAQGGIPDYEAAALRRTGVWVARHAGALRDARPAPEIHAPGRDFALRHGSTLYYFAFDLPIAGDVHVTVRQGVLPQRALAGLPGKIRSARWLDSGERLEFAQTSDGDAAVLGLTPYPYGTSLVVRIAELRLGGSAS
jgi:alpha-L-fucosidase